MGDGQERATVIGSGGASGSPRGQLQLALEIIPDAAVVVDAEGHIVGINKTAEDLFGYEAPDLLGQRIELLIPERFRHAHRHHRQSFGESPRQRAMGAGLQLFGRRLDASEFPVDISLAPVGPDDGSLVLAAIRDATERGAVAAAIDQLAAIVSSSRDGILTMTTSGVVTTWNPGAEQLLGTPTEEAIGAHIGTWVPSDESEVLEELMGIIVTGGSPHSRDTVWRTRDGKRIDVAISLSPMQDEHLELRGFSILVRDITERKSVEVTRRRQALLQAATAEVRLASMSDSPLQITLELICQRVLELTEGEGSAIIRERHGTLELTASSGDPSGHTAQELGQALLGSTDAQAPAGPAWTASKLDLSLTESGRPFEAVGALLPATSGERGALVVMLPPGVEAGVEIRATVEGFAGQTALAIELAQARAARERLLLAEDRERIGRDLHDLVIQRLFATGMGLQTIQQFASDDAIVQRLQQATDELDTTIREIRTTIFALEPTPSKTEGARSELLRLVAGATRSLGFQPSLQFDGPIDLMDDQLRHQVVAVIREALANVARHANASSASVIVAARDGFSVLVEDDGIGMPERRQESGIANIRERARQLGGELDIATRKDGGTRLTWRVPDY